MNIENDTFKPFMKPNNTPLYVHKLSNHPPNVTKNIPAAVNRRLSSISSNEEMFNSAAPTYQEALKSSGYNYQLKFNPPPEEGGKGRSRKRKILWFNPPYSSNVKTKIGEKFLRLVDQHFPPSNPLSKLLNRNTVKISYRCTPNMKKIISSHNAKIIQNSENETEARACNCSKNATCPLDGNCLATNIIYQATVTQADGVENTYIGLTARTFKVRWGEHKQSFRKQGYKPSTLSKHIWVLKRNNIDYSISWKRIATAKPYSPVTGVCHLCTREKYYIVFKSELATLNSREEIKSNCRHKPSKLLEKT